MRRTAVRTVLFSVYFICALTATGQPLPINDVFTYADSTGKLTAEDIVAPSFQRRFLLSRNLSETHPTWVKILIAPDVQPGSYCIDFFISSELQAYYFTADSSLRSVRFGQFVAPSARSVPSHPRAFCFEISDKSRAVYVKVPPMGIDGQRVGNIQSTPKEEFQRSQSRQLNTSFAITGVIALILLASLILLYLSRDSTFLFFAIYLIFFYCMIYKEFLSFLLADEFPLLFLSPFLNQTMFVLGPLSFLLFSWVYFRVGEGVAYWRYLFLTAIPVACAAIVTTIANFALGTYIILFFNFGALVLVAALAARRYFVHKWKPAGYFLAAVLVPLCVAAIVVAQYLGLGAIIRVQGLAGFSLVVFSLILCVGVIQRYRRMMVDRIVREREAETLRIRSAELRDLNETKDKLLSVLAHDLRGPVGNLNAILTLLTERVMSVDEFHQVSGKLRSDVETTYGMLEGVLAWVKTQREGIVVRPEEFDMATLVQEVIRLVDRQAEAKRIQLETISGGPTRAFADPNHMSIVLRNLLGNAIKFSPKGGKVVVSIESSGQRISVMVRDEGVGLDEALVNKIVRQEQIIGKTGTGGETGTGLGLRLCQDFIEYNKGTFHLSSAKGKGTIAGFTIQSGQ